jgi:hypothetical protein
MTDSRAAAMLTADNVGGLTVASVAKGFAEEPVSEVKRRLSGARHEALDLGVVLDAFDGTSVRANRRSYSRPRESSGSTTNSGTYPPTTG